MISFERSNRKHYPGNSSNALSVAIANIMLLILAGFVVTVSVADPYSRIG